MLRAAIPIAEASTPLGLQRCAPEAHCDQYQRCARRHASLCDRRAPIDATALWKLDHCPMFVDVHGVALEAA